jgi:hypothetical protein
MSKREEKEKYKKRNNINNEKKSVIANSRTKKIETMYVYMS